MAESATLADIDPLGKLLAEAALGDRQAFARIYQLSANRLLPIALRIVGRREAAEDVLQEAYLAIWRRAAQYSPERGQPLAWMSVIVRHRAIDYLRRHAKGPHSPLEWNEATEAEAGPLLGAEALPEHLSASVRACLGRLKTEQQKAICLAFYYGMTHEELALQLAAPLGTVKSWVRRGLLQMKECLEP
ncbi:MAG: sigma-70 family RNA polymerase sigma factor [Pseudomonadota bacterium]